jgi:putative intracellular protease/amidase
VREIAPQAVWCEVEHVPQELVNVQGQSQPLDFLKGKRVAALQFCEPEVRLAGGIYVDVGPTEACVDGTLVSAKGWTGLAAFMRECMKVLGTKIEHGAITPAKTAGKVSLIAAE